MIPAYPKPSQVRKPKPAVRVFRDGREVCTDTKAGWEEYDRRKRVAWEEQKRLCSLCGKPLRWADSSIDHKKPRGMGAGSRDDRQENVAAAHHFCNAARGSKRTGYEEEGGDGSDKANN
jgi:5-methylcytosine-specific restriction endonuclease McrA